VEIWHDDGARPIVTDLWATLVFPTTLARGGLAVDLVPFGRKYIIKPSMGGESACPANDHAARWPAV
jgi:hypothetical protein